MNEFLQKILVDEGLTHEQMAETIGVNRSYLSRLVREDKNVSKGILAKINKYFPKYMKYFREKKVFKVKDEMRHKNLNCINKCYHMKVQKRHLKKARPVCPICGGDMLSKEDKKLLREGKIC